MRVIFVDGSEVTHVLAARAAEEGDKMVLRSEEGDIVAEFDRAEVASVEIAA